MGRGWARVPLVEAERYAGQLLDLIREGCEHTEVAGEIRRQQATINESIEIIAVPIVIEQYDLFDERRGDRNLLIEIIGRLIDQDRLEERVEKERGKRRVNEHPMRLLFRADGGKLCPIDLWTTDAEKFGVVLALRTGPAKLRIALTTPRQSISSVGRAGLIPRDMQCSERTGLVYRETGARIPTHTEEAFFEMIDAAIPTPERRR
jgi:DNA polymerase/3'-5' exonuclease PolX